MYSALTTACMVIFFGSAPALLLGRWFRPRRFSWAAVAIGTAVLGWAVLVLDEFVRRRQRQDCEFTVSYHESTATIGGCYLIDEWPTTYNLELGWLKGLVYLVPWLILYGIAWLIRRRRRSDLGLPPNKSLERTRDR